ncbi:NAD(P)-binding protein [Clavulina sp. PMI_390]|nr:NAD(P)-binding protein [Clavulina sp. PMI_390]
MSSPKPTIYILGAGPGVGSELASLFATHNFNIGLTTRSTSSSTSIAAKLKELHPNTTIVTATADGSRPESVTAALDSLREQFEGRAPTVVVYNIASLGRDNSSLGPTPLENVTLETMQTHLTISLASGFVTAQWAAKNLAPASDGMKPMLFFTGGGLGVSPNPKLAGLSMAKAALRNLSMSYHLELKPKGIHAATVMIMATITPNNPNHTPKLIAAEFWKLYKQKDVDLWSPEVLY